MDPITVGGFLGRAALVVGALLALSMLMGAGLALLTRRGDRDEDTAPVGLRDDEIRARLSADLRARAGGAEVSALRPRNTGLGRQRFTVVGRDQISARERMKAH